MNSRMINFYMTMAKECAKLSRARRLQVGSVLVKNNNIISFSWNGMPAGWENDCEQVELMPTKLNSWLEPDKILHDWPLVGKFWINGQEIETRYRFKTKPEVLHAESNVIAKVARSTESAQDADLFITHSPCLECAKLIYQSGIRRVLYGENYRDNSGIEFLKKSGLEVKKINSEDSDG